VQCGNVRPQFLAIREQQPIQTGQQLHIDAAIAPAGQLLIENYIKVRLALPDMHWYQEQSGGMHVVMCMRKLSRACQPHLLLHFANKHAGCLLQNHEHWKHLQHITKPCTPLLLLPMVLPDLTH
jgi:hypothetical protein